MTSLCLSSFEQSGALSAIDVELARTLGRASGETDEAVLLAAALASRAVQTGHVCVDLTRLTLGRVDAGSPEAAPLTLPPVGAWVEKLRRSALVRRDHERAASRPLVLDSEGRLYLARYFDHERSVAERLADLAKATPTGQVPTSEQLDRLFGAAGSAGEQRQAAALASQRALSIIVGGPGTGKTSTVVKLLALMIEAALDLGLSPPRILLLAPTGKAAQRLSEATSGACSRLATSDSVRAAIPQKATTIHRALGSIDGTTTRFRHHAQHPLDCDIVLVDEASMVDLSLMRRLLDALPRNARLILLGDPDQLASVEAGGVLGDVCAAAERGDGLGQAVTRLTRSYRYPEGSGIAALAAAIRAERPEDVLAVLRRGLADAQLQPPLKGGPVGPGFARLCQRHYRGLRARPLEAKLAALSAFRVLCAHRRGPAGVELLNPALAKIVHGPIAQGRTHYPGRPIMVTRNDYGCSLFNGDVAVLHAAGRDLRVYAYFADDTQQPREVAVGRLPDHESVYAMTIHKSQGSEFDHVAIVLPEGSSHLLSRELLYTAVTRARRSVSLFASPATLTAATTSRIVRSSGLTDRLTSAIRHSPQHALDT